MIEVIINNNNLFLSIYYYNFLYSVNELNNI